MNYFLLLVILLLCGGGYFEYTHLQEAQQEKLATDQKQITYLSDRSDKVEAEKKKIESEEALLTKSMEDAHAKIADLTAQLEKAQKATAETNAPSSSPNSNTNAVTSPTAAATAPTNNLGIIATLDGKTFQNCQLLKVEADGIVVNHSEGIIKINYAMLPPELQKRFGYDSQQAAALTEAQIQFQEEQRKAAAPAAGN